MFRGITMERLKSVEERERERMLERKGEIGGNWCGNRALARVLLVKRDSLKSLSTVVYFLAIPCPRGQSFVRQTGQRGGREWKEEDR